MTNAINKVKSKTQIGKIFRTQVRGLISPIQGGKKPAFLVAQTVKNLPALGALNLNHWAAREVRPLLLIGTFLSPNSPFQSDEGKSLSIMIHLYSCYIVLGQK